MLRCCWCCCHSRTHSKECGSRHTRLRGLLQDKGQPGGLTLLTITEDHGMYILRFNAETVARGDVAALHCGLFPTREAAETGRSM